MDDITYLKTHQSWSYSARVLDLASKKIFGYALLQIADANLANDSLLDTMNRQQINITQSMSRRGNCWGNGAVL